MIYVYLSTADSIIRAPILENSTVILVCKLDSVDGRKIMMKGQMTDPDSKKVLADCSTLFITAKKQMVLYYSALALYDKITHYFS